MIKKILLCIVLTWILLITAIEISIISEDLITGSVGVSKTKILKTIGFYL